MRPALLATTAALGLAASQPTTAGAETIRYMTAGGIYLEHITQAFLEPIGEKLGVTWSIETSDNDTLIRLEHAAGAPTFDIVEFGASQCARGAADGLYEELDFDIIDVSDFTPGSYSDHFVGSTIFSTVLGYNTENIANPPSNWAEFWDVENFPGTRSLRRTARHMLEGALMADGVPPEEVYPMDLDRAIDSLGRIRPHVTAWWGSGAEAQQLVRDGGIDLIWTFNARLDSAAADGAPITYTFNQGIMEFGCWAIVKGTRNKDLAMRILAEFAKPEYQAEMARLSGYGAANMAIFETGIIDAETAATLPTAPDNVNRQLLLDAAWWAENAPEAIERFDQFMTE